MGPTWGPSGADRTQVGPCWPHELCYLGNFSGCVCDFGADFLDYTYRLWEYNTGIKLNANFERNVSRIGRGFESMTSRVSETPLDTYSGGQRANHSAMTHPSNYANPVYGVATICHQVRCLRWGHPSLFRTAKSLLIWYKIFCMRDILFRLTWMKFINTLSVYAQSGTHRRVKWWIVVVLT